MRGRTVFRLVAAIYAMLDAVHRFLVLIFGHPQPIDWWLLAADVAIVALIIWLDVPERIHKRRCAKIVPFLFEFMDKGQKMQNDVPEPSPGSPNQDWPRFQAWVTSVNNWSSETNGFLASKSARASASFLLVVDSSSRDNLIYRPDGRSFYVSGGVRLCYQRLVSQLDNLREIMEKPDVYF